MLKSLRPFFPSLKSLYVLLLESMKPVTECDLEGLKLCGILLKRVGVIPLPGGCLSVQFFFNFSLTRATKRWWSETTSAHRLTCTSCRDLLNFFDMHTWSNFPLYGLMMPM